MGNPLTRRRPPAARRANETRLAKDAATAAAPPPPRDRFALDARSLAAFRALLALAHLRLLVDAWPSVEALASGAGVFDDATLHPHAASWAAAPLRYRRDGAWALAWHSFAVAATVCLGAGFFTGPATAATWYAVVARAAHRPATHAGPTGLLGAFLFWGCFLPLGRRWSVDAWLRRSRETDAVAGAGALALRAQVAALYGCSAFVKCFAVDSDWRDGRAVAAALRCRATYATAAGAALGARPRLCARLTGQQKRAKFPTSKAHISVVFRSFRLIFGRAIISRSALDAWMLFPERARAEHSR